VSSILREISSLTHTASPSVIAAAGYNIKSSLTHTISHDKRDDPSLPSKGYLIKSMQEYAGLGKSDVRFLKANLEGQYVETFQELWPRTHFLFGAKCGLLWNLQKDTPTKITDRFFVGGATDVRGFKEYGIGPKDRRSSAFVRKC
jgi:outer membrane protein insertion porin family